MIQVRGYFVVMGVETAIPAARHRVGRAGLTAVVSYDELRADPSRAISTADMRAHLAELHAQRLAERDS